MAFKLKSSGSYYVTFDDSGLTANRTYTLPDSDGDLGGSSGDIINSPVNGRFIVSNGTTNAATASAYLYLDQPQSSIIASASLYVSGTAYFENDLTVQTRAAIQEIRPNTGNLLITGSVYHNSGSFVYTPTFVDYQEKYSVAGIVGGALDLNLNLGNIFEVTVGAAITNFTISNPPYGGNAGSFVLITIATGVAYPIIWPASVVWPGGSAPAVTSAPAGKKDIYGFISTDQGNNWYGFIGAQNL